jgi:hypothetical protein
MTATTQLPAAVAVLPWATDPWQSSIANSNNNSSANSSGSENASTKNEARRPATIAAPTSNKPTIPNSDKVIAHDHDILAAAVLIDVLTTQTAKLSGEPTVLADLTLTTLALLNIGNRQDDAHALSLLRFAMGSGGLLRASLARNLVAALKKANNTQVSCSPATVAAALKRIEAMGQIVIREALAVLESHETTAYRQA